jgi:putative transposase
MIEWFTARELADRKLPGCPASERGVHLLAQREGWEGKKSPASEPLARKRDGSKGGGGMEFHVSLLPPSARTALAARAAKINSIDLPQLPFPIEADPAVANEARLLRRDARLAVLLMADTHFTQNRSMGRKASDADFAHRWNRAEHQADAWLRDALPSLSATSIGRWRKARDEGRLHAVGGEGRKVPSLLQSVEGGEVAAQIAGLIIHQPFLTARHVRDFIEGKFGSHLKLGSATVELPHERTFQRFITEWKETHSNVFQKLTNPDAYKSRTRFAGTNMNAGVTRPNELWEIDASPADVLLVDGRYSIYVAVDIFSRRVLLFVSKTARSEAVLLLLRKAIMAWGVPETIRTDNGSDFTSRISTRALLNLGITPDVTAAFSPEQKGVVERTIGSMQRDLATMLPGFVGHSVSDRKEIEARKSFAARLGESDAKAFCTELTHQEFQAYADDWADTRYANRTHSALGMSPKAKAQSSTAVLRQITNIHALDLLLSPVEGGYRHVSKRGIRIDGGHFISGALTPGARVFCRHDPEDMGRILVFEDEHGAFICEAICPERAGVDPREAIAVARAEQNRRVKDEIAEIRKAPKIKPRDVIDTVLANDRRKAMEAAGNVIALPKRIEDHSSPALDHAADAVAEMQSPAFDRLLSAPSNTHLTSANSNVVTLPETPKQRFRRALELQRLMEAGENIDTEDAIWLGGYIAGDQFKSHKDMLETFGSEWLNL